MGGLGWSRNAARQFGLRDITTDIDAAGGIRWSRDRRLRFAPFGQMVVGLERERTDVERFGTDWSASVLLQPGAGLVVRAAGRTKLFGEIDWRHVPQHSDDANALRVLIGVRFDLQ